MTLDERFTELETQLADTVLIDPKRADPVYYLPYLSHLALEVKRHIPLWAARLRQAGTWDVRIISLSRLVRDIIDRSGQWQEWLACEADFEPSEVNATVAELLSQRLIEALQPFLTTADAPEGRRPINFVTDVEMLHPYFRIHVVETQLHDRITVPTVIFYPGVRSGASGLSFLGIYPVDGSYRSRLVGGV